MKRFVHVLSSILLFNLFVACSSTTAVPTVETNSIATFVAGTLTAVPSATSAPVLTATSDSTKHAASLDRSDFLSVTQWLWFSIRENQPEMIAELIGQNGVQFWPYATGAVFLGYNNSESIAAELRKGLNSSSPQCLGYNPDFGTLPDKGIMIFEGINFDWQSLGFEENKSDIVGFQFFRMEQGWELVYITPIPVEFWPELKETLVKCL